MSARYAFEPADLAVLLDLDLEAPADRCDIEFVQEILVRRGMVNDHDEPIPDVEPQRRRVRPTLYVVPDAAL